MRLHSRVLEAVISVSVTMWTIAPPSARERFDAPLGARSRTDDFVSATEPLGVSVRAVVVGIDR